jgi:hypothetical protein
VSGLRASPLEVEASHFVDAGQRDAKGQYDYYCRGRHGHFPEGAETLILRTYSDDPKTAFFVGVTCDEATAAKLADEAVRYLMSKGRTDFLCLSPERTYEFWTSGR